MFLRQIREALAKENRKDIIEKLKGGRNDLQNAALFRLIDGEDCPFSTIF